MYNFFSAHCGHFQESVFIAQVAGVGPRFTPRKPYLSLSGLEIAAIVLLSSQIHQFLKLKVVTYF